jgi:hypothetical protein
MLKTFLRKEKYNDLGERERDKERWRKREGESERKRE